MDSVANDLKGLTSCEAVSTTVPERWSTYEAPQPGVVVNAVTEDDVAATVKYCAEKKIPFLAQGGGNGWADFNLTSNGVLINLAALNQTTFNADKTQATIGGGATVKSTIEAADKAGALVLTGNCNCVGTLGATLGGGYGNLMGEYGFGVDQLISARVVTADGKLVTASESENEDLFWAIRGAGPNFGIVTSAVFKSYPEEDRTGFNMALVYTTDTHNITDVVKTVDQVRQNLKPEQVVYLYLTNGGPPSNAPAIVVTGFMLHATEDEGKAAYQPLYDLNPVAITNVTLPYTQWNAAADSFCTRAPRKPGLNEGITKLVPEQWTEIWDLYAEFQKKPTAENSVVIVEMYNLGKARSISADSTAFPHRDVNAQAFVIPWYSDTALDKEALAFASKVRGIWRSTESKDSAYINFAHGDEGLEAIYGESLNKLKVIKKKWDPKNRFNQWFPIQ